jgi:hypothetical protein
MELGVLISQIKDTLMPKQKPEVPVDDETPCDTHTPAPSLTNPSHPSQWKHRRRMAYASLVSIIVVTFILLGPWVPVERVERLSDLISWFYFSLASIVGAYMGFATWAAKLGKG